MFFVRCGWAYVSFYSSIYNILISKSWNLIFIVATLLLRHISVAFQSIQSYLVHYGPFIQFRSNLVYFRQIRSTLVYLFHFGPFLSIWSISAHFSSFSPLRWCIVRKGLCRKKSCLIDNYVLGVMLEDFLFDPFNQLQFIQSTLVMHCEKRFV